MKKNKLPTEHDDEYGYYDEEDPGNRSHARSNLKSKQSKRSILSKRFKTNENEEGIKFIN